MQTPHILIVEDELVTRNTLKSIFEAEGYIVLEANNGDEMHQALTSHTINLVIMDINLPGKNGLLLARELREDDNIALMFLTGRDNEVDKILGLEIGADDYITKPFNPRELTIRARNLLSRTMNVAAGGEEKKLVERYLFNGWALDINSRALVSPGRPRPERGGCARPAYRARRSPASAAGTAPAAGASPGTGRGAGRRGAGRWPPAGSRRSGPCRRGPRPGPGRGCAAP